MKRMHVSNRSAQTLRAWGPLLLVGAFALLLFAAPPALIGQPGADIPGKLSQFMAGRTMDNTRKIGAFNPTNREQFVLVIYYDQDGDLETETSNFSAADVGNGNGCVGVVIPPHGDDDDVIYDAGQSYISAFEAIAVPTSGASAGRFDRTGRQRLGVFMKTGRGGMAHALHPSLFALPEGDNLDDLTTCACDELAAWSQPADLLEDVGITCP